MGNKCKSCIHRPQKAKIKEFSKKCIIALTVMWFIGALIGIFCVIMQVTRNDMTVNLGDLLLYIGAPMTGGIVSYMLKSAYEKRLPQKNHSKYNENENEREDITNEIYY